MSKALVSVLLILVAGGAFAASKDEAQQKVDAVKIDTCNKLKTFLATQKCAEAAEAASVTCTAETYKVMNDINARCMASGPAKKASATATPTGAKPAATATAGSTGKAAAVALPKDACRATDETGAVLAEATADEFKVCSEQIKAAVKKAKCDGTAKRVKYTFQRGALSPYTASVDCSS